MFDNGINILYHPVQCKLTCTFQNLAPASIKLNPVYDHDHDLYLYMEFESFFVKRNNKTKQIDYGQRADVFTICVCHVFCSVVLFMYWNYWSLTFSHSHDLLFMEFEFESYFLQQNKSVSTLGQSRISGGHQNFTAERRSVI